MHNWFKEAEKFTPELKVLLLQGPTAISILSRFHTMTLC
jgi:hypothetical protein